MNSVYVRDVDDQIQMRSSNETELTKIRIMRSHVEKQDPSSKEVDDHMIRRFLRARDLDVEKGAALLLKCLSWRRQVMPCGFVDPASITNDIGHNKVFMQGADRMGRPLVVAFGGRHQQTSLQEFKGYVAYTLEKICSRMPSGQEKFVCIADMKGYGYSNSDIRGYLAALTILQDCYPERLGKLFVVHVPYLFMTAWKVVHPLIDDKTQKKIVFVQDNKLTSTLVADIEEAQIPDVYGGKLQLVPIQDC